MAQIVTKYFKGINSYYPLNVRSPHGIADENSRVHDCLSEGIKTAFRWLEYASASPAYVISTGEMYKGSTEITKLNKLKRVFFYGLIGPLMSVANAVHHLIGIFQAVGSFFFIPCTDTTLINVSIHLSHALNGVVRNVIRAVPLAGFFFTYGFDKLEEAVWNKARMCVELEPLENPYEPEFIPI